MNTANRQARVSELLRETVARGCPACGDETSAVSFSDGNRREGLGGRWAYERCMACGTLYLKVCPSPESLAELYGKTLIERAPLEGGHGAVERSRVGAALRARLLRAARGMLRQPHSWPLEPGEGRRILDFGCFLGGKLAEFRERGWGIAGIDLSEEAIDQARRAFPNGAFFSGPLANLPREERFDAIRADNVLEHLHDPLASIRALRTHLRAGGRFLAYVPSADALSVRVLRGRSQNSWLPFHLQLFSRKGLSLLLKRAGFESVSLHGYSPPSWWAITARQCLASPGFLGRPRSGLERVGVMATKVLRPFWALVGLTRLAEEIVADAR